MFVCWGSRNKYHRQRGLNNRSLFSHSSGDWRSETDVSAGSVSPKAPLLPLSVVCRWLSLCCLFTSSSLSCVPVPGVSLCVLISSSYKDTCHIGLGPTLMTSSQLNYLFQGPVSHAEGLGVRTSVYILGKHSSAHKSPPALSQSRVNM